MLVYQGVIAFEMWTGQTPDEAAMKSALSAGPDGSLGAGCHGDGAPPRRLIRVTSMRFEPGQRR